MSPTRWNRVSDLFSRALESDGSDRERLLASEEPLLRREVERMLREHESSGGPLDERLFTSGFRSEEAFWTGRLLKDRYRIDSFLACGGAAAVYRARDEQLAGRRVIVKFLHGWASHDLWLKHKFRQEMEALARIDHRGVVGVLDAGETPEGLPFLVIEYINGVTLRSEIEKGPFPVSRSSQLIREIGHAVAAAHEKGVLHRDLKPENIMLEHPGTAAEAIHLIDFGIARVDHDDRETVTRITRFAGTTQYMAPEHLAGKPQPASDTYAIGVIAYEMLTGTRPYLAASPVELYQQQRAGVKADALLQRRIPRPAARAILKQLSFRPESRSASALEAAELMAGALLGPDREPWSRRRIAGMLLGCAGVVAGGVYDLRENREAPLHPSERVLELPMGTDPLEQGFRKDLIIDYHVLLNAEATAMDSIRVISTDQGGYYHPFTYAQSRAAWRRGWRMIMDAAVEEGNVYGLVDYPHDPRRYVLDLFRKPDGTDAVRCIEGYTQGFQGPHWTLSGPPGARHHLVVEWAPGGAGADVFVDGVKRISGYKGASDFRYSRGLQFGATRSQSARGSGVFWKIRLEIA